MKVSKHAFKRFEDRVLDLRSAKDFDSLVEMFKTVLHGCRLVKYKGDHCFYHSNDSIVFATDNYSTNNHDKIKFISTVIKDVDKDKVQYTDMFVSFNSGDYKLVEDKPS